MKVLSKLMSAESLFTTQRQQYRESIALTDTVPANTSKICKVSVSNLGHFYCMFMTGNFETLKKINYTSVDYIIDDGVCHLRARLQDSIGSKILFSDYTPLDMFLSPGRVRSANAVNNVAAYPDSSVVSIAAVPNNFLNPVEFEYLFASNSDILLDVINDSNTPLSFNILFHGVRRIGQNTTGFQK